MTGGVPEGITIRGLLLAVIAGLAVLGPLLFLARGFLPRLSVPRPRWSGREIALVLLTPILLLPVLLLGAGHGVLGAIVLTQVQLGVTAWLAVRLARQRPQGLAALGLRRWPRGGEALAAGITYPVLFFTLVGASGLWALWLERMGHSPQQEVMELLLDLEGVRLLAAAPIVVLVGPFLEELLFRGFLQGVVAARTNDRVAIVVSSGIFALLHGLAPLPMLFGLALFLGWLQARTRSIWIPFAVHAVHNGLTLGLALAARSLVQGTA